MSCVFKPRLKPCQAKIETDFDWNQSRIPLLLEEISC